MTSEPSLVGREWLESSIVWWAHRDVALVAQRNETRDETKQGIVFMQIII
jgi:hypothetical protein